MNVNSKRKAALGVAAAALLISVSGPASAAEEEFKGMIVKSDNSSIVVRSNGADRTIQVTPETRIRAKSGALGMQRDDMPASELLRGLAVEVSTEDGMSATEIDFKSSDLKTARQIAAGLHVTETNVATNATGVATNAAGVATNSGRIDNVGELVAVSRSNVYFAVGSSTLSSDAKAALQSVASQAKAVTGYRLLIVGRADTTGNADRNQRLSEARAAAVHSYLLKSAGVQPQRILPLAAAGESEIAQDPNPPANATEARRVTVTIAVSKSASDAPQ
jgi:outer membrane protein OmpA-like peptidoglycan-associated protein